MQAARAILATLLVSAAAHPDFTPFSRQYTLQPPAERVAERHDVMNSSFGVVGLAANGVPFVMDHYERNKDGKLTFRAPVHEYDDCGGHGDRFGHYHYHLAPVCLLKALGSAVPHVHTWWHGQEEQTHRDWPAYGLSVRVGVALDGVPILNPYHPRSGALLLSTKHDSSSPLDECHGMEMEDGSYAYFLTSTFPFLPPCLRHRPGALLGFEGAKGRPCASAADGEALPGCPDHRMFSRVTRRAEALGRRLAHHGCPAGCGRDCGTTTCGCGSGTPGCGSAGCGCGSALMGYLVDLACWDLPDHAAMDGAMLASEPWNHTGWCMRVPVCFNSGFGLVQETGCGTGAWNLTYRFDEEGNKMARALVLYSCSHDNIFVKVFKKPRMSGCGCGCGCGSHCGCGGSGSMGCGCGSHSCGSAGCGCGSQSAMGCGCGSPSCGCGSPGCGCGSPGCGCGSPACGSGCGSPSKMVPVLEVGCLVQVDRCCMKSCGCGCGCGSASCGSASCGCGGSGSMGCGCGSTSGCGCGSSAGCGCGGSGSMGCGCGSTTSGCGCGSSAGCGCGGSGSMGCGCGTNAGCGCGAPSCGCGSSGCGCGSFPPSAPPGFEKPWPASWVPSKCMQPKCSDYTMMQCKALYPAMDKCGSTTCGCGSSTSMEVSSARDFHVGHLTVLMSLILLVAQEGLASRVWG